MAPQARIEELVVPSAKERGPIEIDFTYSAEASPIVALDVALSTPLGAVHEFLPALLAGVEGSRGAGRIVLDLRTLPSGPAELTLAPVQADSNLGESASAGLEVPGDGGRAPRLRGVAVTDELITRPNGDDVALARVTVSAAAGEHEVVATWVRLRQPDGRETVAAATPPPAGKGSVTFVALGAGHALGEYGVDIALLDAAGNLSQTLETGFELVADGGAQGPSIDGFKPVAAAAGDEVVIRGRGLDAQDLAVEVGGVGVDVLAADADGLRIRMPAIDVPGRVVVTGPAGTGLSAEQLVPRPQVRVVPETVEVPEGAMVALSAIVSGTTDGAVEWQVAARGGEPGSVSPEGVYTPPPGGVRGAITISAASAASPDVIGRARVRVVAHPPARGPLRLGPLGGTVRSDDDACALIIPRGALAELTTIGIETTPLEVDDVGGEIVVGAARIDGVAGALGAPAELTLPLRFPMLEGEKIRVQVRDDLGDPWHDLPDFGFVIPAGEALKIRLDSLNVHYQGKIEYTPGTTPSYLPSITSLSPTAVDEGATVAVLVTGKNFVPGVTTVSVLTQAGPVESRVAVRAVHVTADGTKLGVTLKAGVMTDLAEGSTRSLRLRVTTPAGSAERGFGIVGHDELDVQGVVTLSQSKTFSRVTVAPGATLRVAHTSPPITVTAFETFVVGGPQGRADVDVLTGSGAPGTRGDAPAGGGLGGAGGATASPGAVAGGGGAGGSGGFGSTGNGTPGSAGSAPAGTLAGGGGGGGFGGFGFGRDGASGAAAPMPGFPSALFAPPLITGAGGGGGGGGGGEGLVIKTRAGGGGGAGAGGGALALAAGEELRIRGRVAANGGNGGAGAFPFPVGTPPAPPLFHAGCGGGGGGGGGGGIALHGVRLLDGEVLAVGGTTGTAARFADAVITTPDTRTPLQKLLANPQSGLIRIDGAAAATPTIAPGAFSIPDLEYRPNLVAPAPQLVVEGATPGTLRVQNSAGADFVPALGSPFAATVSLAPGFNDIDGVVMIDDRPGGPLIILAEAAPVRRRRILYIPGVVAVFGFTCVISPATPTVATERSIKLTANVTGTTQSAVTWSVDGGAANGNVAQDGTFRAPCNVPPAAVTVRAKSVFDPSRSGTASVTVLPGIAVTASATVGTPADATAPSANVGQLITIAIPAATRTLTGENFVAGQNVAFETISRDATGTCVTGTTPVTGNVQPGMTSLRAAVPPCAAPDQRVRVSGHGCARLQVVPRITSLNRAASLGQNMGVNGSGFVCGATQVFFGATQVPAAQVLSVACDVILLGTRPQAGQQVTVRTAGGTSNGVA